MSHFCFMYDIFTHIFKYHFPCYTYMARDKKKWKSHKEYYAKEVTRSLYLGLATPVILHGISDQKKQ